MSSIASLLRDASIVDKNGKMQTRFYEWTNRVTRLGIIEGTGTPEGNIEAPVTTLYMDSTGASGAVLYIKRDSDVSGDRKKGWIAV